MLDRHRACIVALSLAAFAGMVAAVLPDDHEPSRPVSTEGRAQSPAHAAPTPSTSSDAGPPSQMEAAPPAAVARATDGRDASDGAPPTGPVVPAEAGGSVDSAGAPMDQPAPPTPTTAPPATGGPTLPAGPPHLLDRVLMARVDGLYSVRSDGTDLRKEVQCPHGGAAIGPVDVSPDGRWVAMSCADDDGSAMLPLFGIPSLYLLRSDGSEVRRLVRGRFTSPAWSPDGRTVAVLDEDGLTLLDVVSGSSRLLDIHFPEDDPEARRGLAGVSWAPDGRRLVLDNLLILDIATGEATRLRPTGSRHAEYDLARWSPDGAWIYARAFPTSYYYESPEQLQRIDPATGAFEVVLDDLDISPHGPMNDYQGKHTMWSPAITADAKVMFMRFGSLWSMELDGTGLVELAHQPTVRRLATAASG